ncbi:MAG: hypothetical protein C4617_02865 [Candidatus Liberibacter europaeus]|uniref:Antitoxin SocA-like Panacea domain-containing protein n=1 Tax=Candidatus Liberibacter europaeus TaxID=744859 RepID=A0A2T4VYA7_9HYPH|nr:hypothetical protein [Candidatus Liberibacter europaeus]PTL86762.1 MAG: hypothetical protein C4617_02865 [Candidatus Liberibacter europaeus]
MEQAPKAWQYGPVYSDIYHDLSKWGRNSIKTLIIDEDTELPYSETLSEFQERVIDLVLEKYGKVNAFDLSDKTHQSGYTLGNII